jgi:hypothetical protein
MKIIIAGSRTITEYGFIEEAVEESGFEITEVVSGTAKGVDKLGELWAENNDVDIMEFPADWKNITVPGAVIKTNKYGSYNAIAGHMRNAEMAKYADALIAVWDGRSNGTYNMIKRMEAHNKPVFVYDITKI